MALNIRKFLQGIGIVPKTSSTIDQKGEMEVLDGSGKLNYHNGTSVSPVVTEAHSATLTNKTIDGDDNTIQDVGISSLKTVLADANKVIKRDAAGAVISGNSVPNSSDLVTTDSSQALTNKTIDGDNNTLQDIGISSLKTVLADANKVIRRDVSGAIISGNSIPDSNELVTTLASQSLSNKTLTSGSKLSFEDNLQSGSNITLTAPTSPNTRLAGAVTSIQSIAASVESFFVLTNGTGNDVTIKNLSGSAGTQIFTGTGGDITLVNGASLFLVYNSGNLRWQVVGGTGGASTVNLTAGENLALGDMVYISTGTGADSGRTAGRAYKLDAANDDRVEFLGCATSTVSSGSSVNVQVNGEFKNLSGLSVGKPVFASVTTPGALQTTAPTAANQWVIPVGIATSATTLALNGAGSATAVKITSEVVDNLYADVQTYSANTTLTNANSVVLVNAASGAVTITLPAPARGKIFNIKKTDSSLNAVTISPPSGTIDGAASKSLAFQWDSLSITSDGTNFFLI